MSLGSHLERCDLTHARVREEYVDVTMLLFHNGIEPVQIFQARYVARDRRDVSPDKGCGLFQLFLSSASDHDVGTFFHEALSCGQADPAVAASYDHDFSCKFTHGFETPIYLFKGTRKWVPWLTYLQLASMLTITMVLASCKLFR